ncbi:MAG: hypothetical protein IKU30_01080 [Clostridia bacterium]|nr:hypothetical protein [Clostridia bacterium]
MEMIYPRIDRALKKYRLPVALNVAIKKSIQDEILQLTDETADTVMMIGLLALKEEFGFGAERLNKYSKKAQEILNDAYARYGLDAIFALKRRLEEEGIKYVSKR